MYSSESWSCLIQFAPSLFNILYPLFAMKCRSFIKGQVTQLLRIIKSFRNKPRMYWGRLPSDRLAYISVAGSSTVVNKTGYIGGLTNYFTGRIVTGRSPSAPTNIGASHFRIGSLFPFFPTQYVCQCALLMCGRGFACVPP